MNAPTDHDNKVGYCHPPKASRFRRGQSGNPKGRPKGRKNIGTMIADAFYRKVDVREGNRVRSISKIEAALEVTLNKALKGDHRSFAKLLEVAAKLLLIEPPPSQPWPTRIERVVISPREEIQRRLHAIAADKEPYDSDDRNAERHR